MLSPVLQIGLTSAGVGAVIGYFRSGEALTASDLASGALTGLVIGLGASSIELFVFSNAQLRLTRRLPVIALMAIRAVTLSLLILIGLSTPQLMAGNGWPWADPEFVDVFLLAAVICLGFSIAIEVMRLLGSEAAFAFLTGRYTRARREERVILFADLVGSTRLAERIGDMAFHAVLTDIALDFADPIKRNRGDTHRYVGDSVIVTWPLSRGVDKAHCLHCARGMHAVLAQRADTYERDYGTRPQIRIALHCGPVAAGEIGDWKKEIVILGDTMNTAARIEQAARDLGAATVLSDALVQALPDAARAGLRPLPPYMAHGKATPLTLWAAGKASAQDGFPPNSLSR